MISLVKILKEIKLRNSETSYIFIIEEDNDGWLDGHLILPWGRVGFTLRDDDRYLEKWFLSGDIKKFPEVAEEYNKIITFFRKKEIKYILNTEADGTKIIEIHDFHQPNFFLQIDRSQINEIKVVNNIPFSMVHKLYRDKLFNDIDDTSTLKSYNLLKKYGFGGDEKPLEFIRSLSPDKLTEFYKDLQQL